MNGVLSLAVGSVYFFEQEPWPVQFCVRDSQVERDGKQVGKMPGREVVLFATEAAILSVVVDCTAGKSSRGSSCCGCWRLCRRLCCGMLYVPQMFLSLLAAPELVVAEMTVMDQLVVSSSFWESTKSQNSIASAAVEAMVMVSGPSKALKGSR